MMQALRIAATGMQAQPFIFYPLQPKQSFDFVGEDTPHPTQTYAIASGLRLSNTGESK